MTQAPTLGPPAPAPGPAPTPAPTATATASVPGAPVPARHGLVLTLVRRLLEGTPGRMRLLGGLAALAATVFGLVGANTLWSSAAALERANRNTSQVVRVQSVYTDLVRADADATSSFLVGGLEDPAQRADYEASLMRASTAVAEAATAQPADGKALGTLNSQIQSYAGLIEQARVYNRQGMPVGAQYLKSASTTLRGQTLPIIDALTRANTERATQELSQSSDALALTGTVTLAVLILAMVWLARRTHRYLNAPFAGGAVAVLVTTMVGVVVLGGVAGSARAARTNEFAGTLALTTARAAAYDAKSNESLTLIARGQGKSFEQTWVAQSENVLGNLRTLDAVQGALAGDVRSAGLAAIWRQYASAHTAIRKLDDGGDWEGAVRRATERVPGSASASFATFDQASAQLLTRLQQATADRVLAPRGLATVTGWALLLLSIGAAALVLRGISRRLEEYR